MLGEGCGSSNGALRNPRDQRASPNIMDLNTDLETCSGGKPARHQKTIPTAHLTFIINCAHWKQLFLAAPPVPP